MRRLPIPTKWFPIRSNEGLASGLAVLVLVAGVGLMSMRLRRPEDHRAPPSRPASSIASDDAVSSLRYVLAGDGGAMVRLDLKRLVVLDAATREEIRRCELPGYEPRDAACSPCGNQILAACAPAGAVVLWERGHPVRIGTHCRVVCCALTANQGLAATGCHEGLVQLWDLASRGLRQRLSLGQAIHSMAFSPDGENLLIGGTNGLLVVCRAGEGRIVRRLAGHEGRVLAVAFSPEGRRAVSGGSDGTIRVWDLEGGQELWRETPFPAAEFPGLATTVLRVAWASDGEVIACGGLQKSIHVYDAESGEWLSAFWEHEAPIGTLAFLPDGATVVSAGFGQPLAAWDRATGQRLPMETAPP